MSADQPLVIFHKQLGDVLLLEPALAKLAAATGSDVMLATRPAFAPMLSLMEHVRPMPDSVFRRASQVISFDPRSRACIQTLTTCAPEKRLIVTDPKHLRPWQAVVWPTERRAVDASASYRAEYFFDVMPGAARMAFRPPQLVKPPLAWRPEGLPESYTLLHTTSAWRNKSWSAEAWGRTLDALVTQGMGPFVLTGGNAPWEMEYVQAIQNTTRAPLINLCGKTGVQGYLATVAGARMALCIDGSASHLAAAFGCPALTLFGPSHPLHWHFPAPQSRVVDARSYSPERKPAVSVIPSEAVVEAATLLWVSAP